MHIAGIQMDVQLGAVEHNIAAIEERLNAAAKNGAQLVAFPECAVTGYCFESFAEARELAEPVPGPATERLSAMCRRAGCHAVVGMIERDAERLFNVAVLIGPGGLVASYRKVHLPYLGLDMFTTPGDQAWAVHNVAGTRIGLSICYDASFPESARALTLLGADLVTLPTNWPPGAETTAEHVINARAVENNIYYMSVNRIGTERGFRFIGHSKIAGPFGNTLAEARHTDEAILYAEINPALARQKHLVRVKGKHEIDRLADRRPEMYELLTQPHSLKRPGR